MNISLKFVKTHPNLRRILHPSVTPAGGLNWTLNLACVSPSRFSDFKSFHERISLIFAKCLCGQPVFWRLIFSLDFNNITIIISYCFISRIFSDKMSRTMPRKWSWVRVTTGKLRLHIHTELCNQLKYLLFIWYKILHVTAKTLRWVFSEISEISLIVNKHFAEIPEIF